MQRDSADVPGGPPHAGGQGRRRDRRADQARGRPQGSAALGDGQRHRLLSRGPDRLEDRRGRPGLPPRPRLHRRDDRGLPARLGARRLGHDDPPARGQARHPARGTRRGRPCVAAPEPLGRLRQVPGTRPVPDPGPERQCRRDGRPAAGRRGPEVPEHARRRRCSTRAARSISSIAPSRRSASPARPSSSRATRTPSWPTRPASTTWSPRSARR